MLRSVRRLATALAAVVLAALLAPALAGAADRLETGIQDPLDGIFGETDRDSVLGVVRHEGATLVRVQVTWSNVAPTRPANPSDPDDPAYRWDRLDGRVAAIGRAGLEPLVTLYSTPVWDRERERDGSTTTAPVPADFAAFAMAAARRYDGTNPLRYRVRHWQIWNEPNFAAFFSADSAPERYRAVANAGYDAIHAVASDNVVVAGGLSPFVGKAVIAPMSFMRQMLCMSAGARPRATCHDRSRFDVWAHHPYTAGGPTHSAFRRDDVSLGDLPEMRRVLMAAQRVHHVESPGGVRFWVTEFSWDTTPPDTTGVPVRLHGRWVAEALYRMWKSGVSLAIWFQLRDIDSARTDWGVFGQGGLFYKTADRYAHERAKPAATAFRFPFVAVPGRRAVTAWGRTPDSRSRTVVIERSTRGRWKRVTRVRANAHGIFQLRLRGANGETFRARTGRSRSLPFKAVPTRDRRVQPFGGQPQR